MVRVVVNLVVGIPYLNGFALACNLIHTCLHRAEHGVDDNAAGGSVVICPAAEGAEAWGRGGEVGIKMPFRGRLWKRIAVAPMRRADYNLVRRYMDRAVLSGQP